MQDPSYIEDREYTEFAKTVFSYDLVPRCTVPIAGSKDGKSTLDRTGVLFRVAGLHFLITAQHGDSKENTIIDILDAGYRLFVPPATPNGLMIAFGFRNIWTSSRPGTDYAVFELDSETAVALQDQGMLFAGITDVACMKNTGSERSSYLIAGFPTQLQDHDEHNRRRFEYFHCLTCRWSPHIGRLEDLPSGFDYFDEMHLLLAFEKRLIHSTGKTDFAPRPGGLSGCGVWHARDWNSKVLWTPKSISLVGIQSSWNKFHRCLKVGWINEAMAMIRMQYPSTRRAFSLIEFEG